MSFTLRSSSPFFNSIPCKSASRSSSSSSFPSVSFPTSIVTPMSKLLQTPHRRNISFVALAKPLLPIHLKPSSLFSTLPSATYPRFSLLHRPPLLRSRRLTASRTFSVRAFESSSSDGKNDTVPVKNEDATESAPESETIRRSEDYPTGEFHFKEFGWWMTFLVKLRMLIALPWQRVPKGSVLTMKLRGQISDQLKSRFSSGLSLPQICENFEKASYDPRIAGIYIHIEPLNCGWAKVEEIRRHISNFKQSGKFIVGYIPVCGEKEYYLACACDELYAPPSAYFSLYGMAVQASFLGGVFEKVGVEPQVERIGKYKSAGDQFSRKSMSSENCEMLTALLDNIYGNWLDKVSVTKGKKIEDLENFINEGVYQVERLKEENLITNVCYDDEVISLLKDRLKLRSDKKLSMVDYRKYSKVRKWTVGLSGGKDMIAVIRASGSISRVRSSLSTPSSGIIGEQFIEKIRMLRGISFVALSMLYMYKFLLALTNTRNSIFTLII